MKSEIETLEADCNKLQTEVNQLTDTIEQVKANQEQKRKVRESMFEFFIQELFEQHEENMKRLTSENYKIKFELERKLSSNPKIKKKRG